MKSVGALFALTDAFGLKPGQTEAEGWAAIHGIFEASAAGQAQRQRIRDLVALQDYRFNAHGVELGQFYSSAAVVADGSSVVHAHDQELHHTPSTVPGAPLPHAWIELKGEPVSTLDLVGHDRFTVLTGIGGQRWIEAARQLGPVLGIQLDAVAIGPGLPAADVYGDWARLREIDDYGCLLVRPDRHIAFRAMSDSTDAAGQLGAAMAQILCRPSS